MRTDTSSWRDRANRSIAHGALTNSRRPQVFVNGVYPTHVTHGRDCYVWDPSGKKYIDFMGGLGSCILGYANPEVTKPAIEAIERGQCLTWPTTLEVETAEKLKGIVPFVDQVRFLKTGTEACLAAIRIARAFHGVGVENEDMYKVSYPEGYQFVPSMRVQNGSTSSQSAMQELRERLPISAARHGDKEKGASALCQDTEREVHGGTIQSGAPEAQQGTRTGQGLLLGSETGEASLRGLRNDPKGSGTSRGLLETSRCDLALPNSPRKKARVLVLSDGYHGHGDAFIGLIPPRLGVIPDPYVLPLTGNEHLIPDAAAVLIEPVMTNMSEARREWLQRLRAHCTKHGTILIFDEIVTGFRVPRFTIANHFSIEPDIILLGKAIANGFPLSVVGGKSNVMSGTEYFVSSTFAGEMASLGAAKATMTLLETQKYDLNYLWQTGARFLERFNEIWPSEVRLVGYPTRAIFEGGALSKALLWQEACRAGILFGPSFFFHFGHIGIEDAVLSACSDIVGRIKTGSVRLEGEMPTSPFAAKVRAQSGG